MEWIAKQQSSRYRPEDAIPLEVLLEWYGVNPSGFHVFRSAAGDRIGHIDILPLRKQTLTDLVEGKIVEREIRADCLYSAHHRWLVKTLYVESLMINDRHAMSLKCLLRRYRTLVDQICKPDKLEGIYALAATPNGEKLVGKLGFVVAKPSHQRRDGHNLYTVTPSVLADRIRKILDDSGSQP